MTEIRQECMHGWMDGDEVTENEMSTDNNTPYKLIQIIIKGNPLKVSSNISSNNMLVSVVINA